MTELQQQINRLRTLSDSVAESAEMLDTLAPVITDQQATIRSQQEVIKSQQQTIKEQEDTIESQEETIQEQEQDILGLDEYLEQYEPYVREMIQVLKSAGIFVDDNAVIDPQSKFALRYLLSLMYQHFPSFLDTDPIIKPPLQSFTINKAVETFDCRSINPAATSWRTMFAGASKLEKFTHAEAWDSSLVTTMEEMFNGCRKLKSVDIRAWSGKSIVQNGLSEMFVGGTYECITTFVGDCTIDEVIEQNITVLEGLSTSQKAFPTIYWWGPQITRRSYRALVNGLSDLTGKTSQYIAGGNWMKNNLTEEDIAVATAKNWTIA